MILFSSSLLYFYILSIKCVICVKIFENTILKVESTKSVKFNAEVISKTCLLKPQKGPCRSGIEMFYYNPDMEKCMTFEWGGCQGNGNRFDTIEECQDKCLSQPGAAKRRPKWCSLTFDYGFCFGAIERWYYDKLWQVCKKTIYSGCGGNRNNFYSRSKCESVCIYGNDDIIKGDKEKEERELVINPEKTNKIGDNKDGKTKKGDQSGEAGDLGGIQNNKRRMDRNEALQAQNQ